MDWDSKMPSWDMEEGLVQNVEPNQSGMGSTTSGGRMAMDCSVDLKLGGLGEFRAPDKWKDQPRASPSFTAMVPSASPSKRARPPSGAAQNVSCLVDGCRADLSGCREYHRRHKVCEAHSKTPVVMVAGQEQRFCQQCSRFHMLVEFDEVKRSCRKRLDGHNRRRRKPQPESINSGSLFLNHQGVRFSTYPHILPTPVQEPNWTGIVKAEDEALYNHQQSMHVISEPHFPGSFSRYYKEGKQISFLQDGDAAFTRMAMESSSCQPAIKNISAAESSSSKIFADGLPQVLDSDCALSLLSSTTQTSSINMGQMLSVERIPMAQPLVSSLQYRSLGLYSSSQNSSNVSATGFSCPGVGNEPVGTVLVSDTDGDLHCHDMFHVGDEGSSDGNSHSIPFSWQ